MPKKSTGITYEVRTSDSRVTVDLSQTPDITTEDARQKIGTLPWVNRARVLPGTQGRKLIITGVWPQGYREQIEDLFGQAKPPAKKAAAAKSTSKTGAKAPVKKAMATKKSTTKAGSLTDTKRTAAKKAAPKPGRVTVEAAFAAQGNVLVVDDRVRFTQIAATASRFLGKNGVSRVLFTNVDMDE